MRIGLRVDVDTLRGTVRGVPALVALLGRLRARATFFVSVGPDNMGRHVWRLARPSFLAKMIRTGAPRLYGWDVLLRGTLVPGPLIGVRAAQVIRDLAGTGNELGLHAWDHHGWQSRIGKMSGPQVADHLRRGLDLLQTLTGSPAACSAAPAWRTTNVALGEKKRLDFRYNSDCRGEQPFLPLLDDGTTGQLQVPSTLATFDERVGRGVSAAGYFDEVFDQLETPALPVLTIHAEVEGISVMPLFEAFAERVLAAGHTFVTLGELAAASREVPVCRMSRREVPGREGWTSWQGDRVGQAIPPPPTGGAS